MNQEQREAASEEVSRRAYEIPVMLTSAEAATEVAEFLRSEGADVDYQSPANSVRLAYPIKKQTSAFFGFFQVRLPASGVVAVKDGLARHPAVLRFLIVTPSAPASPSKHVGQPVPPISPKLVEPQEKVLTNEALEKKLEEILK